MATKKQEDLEHMEKLLELMRAKGVMEFTLNNLTVKFDIYKEEKIEVPLYDLDNPEERAKAIRERLETAASDTEQDLMWSVGK